MIALLRLIGVFNAAIWLGGVVFFTVVVTPGLGNDALSSVLQPRNAPYFAPAIRHVALSYFFQFSVVCALVALIQLTVEWLYLGRPVSRKIPLGLVIGLLLYSLVGNNLLQPKIRTLHESRYSAKVKPVEREAANRSFVRWNIFIVVLNWTAIGALTVHFWRLVNPSDTPRFVSSVKFRG